MSTALLVAILGGAVTGLGIYLLLATLVVPTRVSLADALTNTTTRIAPTSAEIDARIPRLGTLQTKLEHRLAATRLTTPDTDLALIEWSRGRFLVTRLGWVAVGVLVGPLLAAIWALIGAGIPPSIPLIVGLALAALGWVFVGLIVRDRAAARRLEVREALVFYLTLVALDMAGGFGRTQAMQSAAGEGDAWTFRRIDARVAASIRAGQAPEAGLKELSSEIGVEELSDVAEILQIAGTDGAQVFETLLARADGLRTQLRLDAEASEAARSSRARVPAALLVLIAMAFVLYPLISGIAG